MTPVFEVARSARESLGKEDGLVATGPGPAQAERERARPPIVLRALGCGDVVRSSSTRPGSAGPDHAGHAHPAGLQARTVMRTRRADEDGARLRPDPLRHRADARRLGERHATRRTCRPRGRDRAAEDRPAPGRASGRRARRRGRARRGPAASRSHRPPAAPARVRSTAVVRTPSPPAPPGPPARPPRQEPAT